MEFVAGLRGGPDARTEHLIGIGALAAELTSEGRNPGLMFAGTHAVVRRSHSRRGRDRRNPGAERMASRFDMSLRTFFRRLREEQTSYCTKLLRDLRADILKIEPPAGDISRLVVPQSKGMSLYFAQQNAGKRATSVDLNFDEGRDIVRSLLKDVDIVVQNFRPGTIDRFGFGYEDVHRLHPRIIYASLSGFGQSTSWRNRPAYARSMTARVAPYRCPVRRGTSAVATCRHPASRRSRASTTPRSFAESVFRIRAIPIYASAA